MRVLTKSVLAILVAGLTACGDSSGPDDGGIVAGTYTLRTINGSGLPFVLAQIGTEFKFEIVSDVFTLKEDNTFTDVATVRFTEEGTVTTETNTYTGTYTTTGSTVRLTDTTGETLTSTFSAGNTLTMNLGNAESGPLTFVYRK